MFKAVSLLHNEYIYADQSEKMDLFTCKMCKEIVMLKKGRIRLPHFAHKSTSNCTYSRESKIHMEAKKEIFDALKSHPQVENLELEKYLEVVRPDIYFTFRHNTGFLEAVVVEVQVSKLSRNDIDRRTQYYTKMGISILWISPLSASKLRLGERYNASDWERYLHGIYYGKVFYWLSGESLLPVEFKKVILKYDSNTWYNEYGEQQESTGYSKPAKKLRIPYFEPLNTIKISSCRSRIRPEYKGVLPRAKLWMPL